jgi:hypothetical protein
VPLHVETSAKTGARVEEAFMSISRLAFERELKLLKQEQARAQRESQNPSAPGNIVRLSKTHDGSTSTENASISAPCTC